MFRAKIYASPENFTPPLEVMEVIFENFVHALHMPLSFVTSLLHLPLICFIFHMSPSSVISFLQQICFRFFTFFLTFFSPTIFDILWIFLMDYFFIFFGFLGLTLGYY